MEKLTSPRRLRIAIVPAMFLAVVAVWFDLLDRGGDSELPTILLGGIWLAWFGNELRDTGARVDRRIMLAGAFFAALMVFSAVMDSL